MELEARHELEVIGARVALGGRDVLRGIDVALPRGRTIALLGASGCGKTTLLRGIAGLTALDEGRVLIGGRDVTQVPAQARGVGVVFQHYALFPNLTVQQNVEFGLRADGHARAEATRRSIELLEMVGLAGLADRRPSRLSGGQRQRVALARALARQPSLLLMDEPFSALDEAFRVPLRRSFRELQQRLGQTCLVVTHDRDEAFELADQVAVMFEGRIVQCDAPEVLWRAPATRDVASFLGAFNLLPANHVPGGLHRDEGWYAAPVSACRIASPDEPAPNSGELSVPALVRSAWAGLQGTSVTLLAEAGQTLEVRHPAGMAAPSPGTRCVVSIDCDALVWVPA